MIIELAGLPGAGKTTVTRKLARDGFEVVAATDLGELCFFNLIALIRRPLWMLRLFAHLLLHSKDASTFWYKFTNLYLHANAKYEKALRCERALIDQGYAQSLISISETALTERAMRSLFIAMPPSRLHLFEVSKERAQERMAGRDYIVLRRHGTEAFHQRLAVMRRNFELMRDIGRAAVVDADQAPEQVYSQTQRLIHGTF